MLMQAVVIEVQWERLLVLDLDTRQTILVNTPDARRFRPGDLIRIRYNGVMTNSIPPQISASNIAVIPRDTVPPAVFPPAVFPPVFFPPIVRPPAGCRPVSPLCAPALRPRLPALVTPVLPRRPPKRGRLLAPFRRPRFHKFPVCVRLPSAPVGYREILHLKNSYKTVTIKMSSRDQYL